ncbi:PspC domain-containing protein, partial [Streptomyces sp. SID10244]|nr:PspC domain-containing protein [Streptomyces sp. SID10244]
FVASILLPGPQVLLYLVLWIVIPREPVAQPPVMTSPMTYPSSSP